MGAPKVALRLPHILVAMTLVLVAGLLSIQHLESRMGGPTVPGIIVLDAPGWDRRAMEHLAEEVGGRVGDVAARDGPLEPLGPDLVRRLVARGDATVICTAIDGADHQALLAEEGLWEVGRDLPPMGDAQRAVVTAATFARAQTTMRSYLVGVLVGPDAVPSAALVQPLLDAAERLPSFRRTAIVVLGARRGPPGPGGELRRETWRLDLGDWRGRVRGELADLLDPGW